MLINLSSSASDCSLSFHRGPGDPCSIFPRTPPGSSPSNGGRTNGGRKSSFFDVFSWASGPGAPGIEISVKNGADPHHDHPKTRNLSPWAPQGPRGGPGGPSSLSPICLSPISVAPTWAPGTHGPLGPMGPWAPWAPGPPPGCPRGEVGAFFFQARSARLE